MSNLSTKYPRLHRIKITKSRKPDLFTSNGKTYFINGVIRNEHFSHMTPMTEAQTEDFFADRKIMTSEELHAKWSEFSIESTEETQALIHGSDEKDETAPPPTTATTSSYSESNREGREYERR